MNPTLPQRVVDEAMEEDRAAALAEYGGQFRDDVATFLPRDVIEAVVIKGPQRIAACIRYTLRGVRRLVGRTAGLGRTRHCPYGLRDGSAGCSEGLETALLAAGSD